MSHFRLQASAFVEAARAGRAARPTPRFIGAPGASHQARAGGTRCIFTDPRNYEFLDESPPSSVSALAEKLARSEDRKYAPDDIVLWLKASSR